MDECYLTKDTIVESGVGDRRDDIVPEKIPPATKTAFTRK